MRASDILDLVDETQGTNAKLGILRDNHRFREIEAGDFVVWWAAGKVSDDPFGFVVEVVDHWGGKRARVMWPTGGLLLHSVDNLKRYDIHSQEEDQ